MNYDLTARLNDTSIEAIRKGISKKISSSPYLANNNTVRSSITDMDHQPYDRFFRGVYYYPDPIIFEREAGFRPLNNTCYKTAQQLKPDEEPLHCFEAACSTIFPCRPSPEKEKLETSIHNECIVQYR
jgi:hypothetical protein